MAQSVGLNSLEIAVSEPKRTYSVSLKGLMAHLMDVLTAKPQARSVTLDAHSLPAHLQRDIGLLR
ncbi:hypothetical protein [Ferrimonas marina]|uniref:Uncharacterized protein n=1 Tax=Ferrimonas marina TaxID=299255 RepID=A0A1M5RAX5_9GAMM|nr:hypothetical protein [Ferrimonas marina]SHH23229.1 hypothetical protein SAMN02745129_1545 [Ferrimonas marina]